MKHRNLFSFSGVLIFNVLIFSTFRLVEKIKENPIPPYSAIAAIIGVIIMIYAAYILLDGYRKRDLISMQIAVWKFFGLLLIGVLISFISYI